MNSFTILGTGSSVPPHRVTNDDLAQMVDTSDEWISTRTGIRERRVLTTQTLTDLAVEASRAPWSRPRCPQGAGPDYLHHPAGRLPHPCRGMCDSGGIGRQLPGL